MISARAVFLGLSLALVATGAENALAEDPQEPAATQKQIEAVQPSADEPSEGEELGIPPDEHDGPAEVHGRDLWSWNTPSRGLSLFLGRPVAGPASANEENTDSRLPETHILPASQDTSPSPSESSPRESDTWRFSLTPHLWLPSQSGEATVNGIAADVGATISETLETANYAVFLLGAATKGKWTIAPYLMASQIEDDDSALGINIETKSTMVVADLAVAYEVYERSIGGDERQRLRVDIYGGLRYQYLKAEIEVGPFNLDESHDWLEPLVGAALTIQVADNFRWDALRLGFSGFGIGSASNLTTTFYSGVALALKEDLHLVFGYRAFNLDYSRGSGSDRFSQDLLMHGPVLGLTFEF